MLPSHLQLILPGPLFLSVFKTEMVCNFVCCSVCVTCPSHRIFLNPFVTSGTYMSHLQRVLFKSAGITVSHFFSMLPSTLKYLYSVEPVRMHFPAKQPCTNDTMCNAACSIAHSIICTRPFRGKMHSDWFNGIQILQGRWQHGEKVGYYYPSGLEKTLFKWDVSRLSRKG